MINIKKYLEDKIDNNLSRYASKNRDAFRKSPIADLSRLDYSIDRDRIIYSGAYRRLSGKTQVIYFPSLKDEELTNRIIHIQYVSQISRTIGAALNLNLDLIEAAALGHDLGHTPFGHDGERFLNEMCQKSGIDRFMHNVHSLYIIDEFSYHGKGMNLTFQVRDAIISHNGEVHNKKIIPNNQKTEADIQDFIKKSAKGASKSDFFPATLEGCVIRICDTIAYIGADIEDAIRIGLIKRTDLPSEATKILGNNNSQIVSSLVNDVINQSFDKNYVAFSSQISDALKDLKKFNFERIYNNPILKRERSKIRRGFALLFEQYLEDLEKKNTQSDIYKHFLDHKNENYLEKNNYIKIRDFIASMTDRYFNNQISKNFVPKV